jgi:hypothetical protein
MDLADNVIPDGQNVVQVFQIRYPFSPEGIDRLLNSFI